MTIQPVDPEHRMSEAVIHQQTIYYTSVPEDLSGDAYQQTPDALSAIDKILQRLGSDESKILDATVIMATKQDFAAMNLARNEWVAPDEAPVLFIIKASH